METKRVEDLSDLQLAEAIAVGQNQLELAIQNITVLKQELSRRLEVAKQATEKQKEEVVVNG